MNIHHIENINGKYFKHRNISESTYENYKLPAYLKTNLPDKSSIILDIGCGLGQMLIALQKEGYENVCGIDILPEAVDYCQNHNLKVQLITDLIDFTTTCTTTYDFIVMSHVLEHLSKDTIIDTLQLIRNKLLKPGGVFFIMVPNAQSNTGCYWAYEDFTHTTLFTAGSLYFVLKSAGFEQVEFIDPLGTADSHPFVKLLKLFLIPIYKAKIAFWNRITNSSFHRPSPQVYTYELKVLTR
jgi:2-polyprenyl-3-methyl-5-hydroxy-6-metoxy-1,4-benzoquinol methylase